MDAEPADGTGGRQPVEHRRPRLVGPDVVRALALIGVVVMNYHGYLNGAGALAGPDASLAERWFDPWNSVLSTRFAATFVVVAGVGVSLLTESSRRSADRAQISDDRWRLIRRGVLLYASGFVLDWIWPGTILFFYGAYFIVAAALFTLRTSWLIVVGSTAALGAAVTRWWIEVRIRDGDPPLWLIEPSTLSTRSPRGLLLDTVVNGTHPLLPWLAFLCAGMVLGRHVEVLRGGRRTLVVAAGGAALTAATYIIHEVAAEDRGSDVVWATIWSTRPFDHGWLYTVGTIGSSLAAVSLVAWLAEHWRATTLVAVLRAGGEMTLTLYLAHVLVFRLVVDRLGLIDAAGLDVALSLALLFWLVSLLGAWLWRSKLGLGPLERPYRRFGG